MSLFIKKQHSHPCVWPFSGMIVELYPFVADSHKDSEKTVIRLCEKSVKGSRRKRLSRRKRSG